MLSKNSVPRLEVNLSSLEGVIEARRFFEAHDGESVYVDIRSDHFSGKGLGEIPEDAHCSACWMKNFHSTSARSLQFWLKPTPGGRSRDYEHQMWVMVPEEPRGTTVISSAGIAGDGKSGAGGVRTKGFFLNMVGGMGAAGPPGMTVVDLRPIAAN